MLTDLDPKKTYKIPSHTCYACDKDATGVTLHNRRIKAGCKRHADPKIKAKHTCMYCGEFVRSGGIRFSERPWDEVHNVCYSADQKRHS